MVELKTKHKKILVNFDAVNDNKKQGRFLSLEKQSFSNTMPKTQTQERFRKQSKCPRNKAIQRLSLPPRDKNGWNDDMAFFSLHLNDSYFPA